MSAGVQAVIDIEKAGIALRDSIDRVDAAIARLGPRPSWWRFKKRRTWDLQASILNAWIELNRAVAKVLLDEAFKQVGAKIAASLEGKAHVAWLVQDTNKETN